MTNEERNFIKKNIQFGFADNSEFPHLEEGKAIPWVAVPNMMRPDGSVRKFSSEEIVHYLLTEDKADRKARNG